MECVDQIIFKVNHSLKCVCKFWYFMYFIYFKILFISFSYNCSNLRLMIQQKLSCEGTYVLSTVKMTVCGIILNGPLCTEFIVVFWNIYFILDFWASGGQRLWSVPITVPAFIPHPIKIHGNTCLEIIITIPKGRESPWVNLGMFTWKCWLLKKRL